MPTLFVISSASARHFWLMIHVTTNPLLLTSVLNKVIDCDKCLIMRFIYEIIVILLPCLYFIALNYQTIEKSTKMVLKITHKDGTNRQWIREDVPDTTWFLGSNEKIVFCVVRFVHHSVPRVQSFLCVEIYQTKLYKQSQ